MVFDGGAAQLATQKLRVKAQRLPAAQLPLTVAGIAIPPEDELKHFRCMRTTSTGKSPVMRELLHAGPSTAAIGRGDRRTARRVSLAVLQPESR